jgi:Sec-independent protein secretion pathway component TatC
LFPFILIPAFVATIGMTWVIFRDAQERGIAESTATIWGLGVAYLFPIVAPLYFLLVVRSRNRETAVTIRERWVAWLSFSFFFSFAFTAIATPPDPFTQALSLLIVLPLVVVGMYIVLIKSNYRLLSNQPN